MFISACTRGVSLERVEDGGDTREIPETQLIPLPHRREKPITAIPSPTCGHQPFVFLLFSLSDGHPVRHPDAENGTHERLMMVLKEKESMSSSNDMTAAAESRYSRGKRYVIGLIIGT